MAMGPVIKPAAGLTGSTRLPRTPANARHPAPASLQKPARANCRGLGQPHGRGNRAMKIEPAPAGMPDSHAAWKRHVKVQIGIARAAAVQNQASRAVERPRLPAFVYGRARKQAGAVS